MNKIGFHIMMITYLYLKTAYLKFFFDHLSVYQIIPEILLSYRYFRKFRRFFEQILRYSTVLRQKHVTFRLFSRLIFSIIK